MSELARESRALLEAARSGDDPRAQDRARIRQRLLQAGVGAAVLTAASSTTAASVASSAAGSGGATGLAATGVAGSAIGGGAAVATGASMGIVAKVLVALAITGTLSATGVKAVSVYHAHREEAAFQASQAKSPLASAPGRSPASVTPSAAVPGEGSSAFVANDEPAPLRSSPSSLNPPPPAEATGAVHAARGPKRSDQGSTSFVAPASPESTLEAETRLLREAEKRRRAGDGEGALALLAEHASRFPNGVLTEERAAARVFTLCDLGRSSEASLEGAKFLRDAPRSPLAPRVRASCARLP